MDYSIVNQVRAWINGQNRHEVVAAVIEGLTFSGKIEVNQLYERYDDEVGNPMRLAVSFNDDHDGFIRISNYPEAPLAKDSNHITLRFNSYGNSGASPRVHAVLMLLAEAIIEENIESSQDHIDRIL